jgi:hypothetical protein
MFQPLKKILDQPPKSFLVKKHWFFGVATMINTIFIYLIFFIINVLNIRKEICLAYPNQGATTLSITIFSIKVLFAILKAVMLSAAFCIVILSGIMLSVVMLSVMAPISFDQKSAHPKAWLGMRWVF